MSDTIDDTRMQAWLFDGVGQPLRRADTPVPAAAPGELAVRVHSVGLCHSDVGFVHGVLPVAIPTPAILGHEIAGTVTAVGEGVTAWAVGDRVVSAISADDAPGVTRNGGYASFATLTADRAVGIPEGVAWNQAAAATDAGVTAYTAVAVDGAVGPGTRVAIVGLGGLGMTAARVAVLLGAEVSGVEPREEAWATAQEQGVGEIVRDVSEFAGRGFDVVADFAGFDSTTSGAIRAIRPGGTIVLVGLGAPQTTFPNAELIGMRARLIGSTPSGDPAHLSAVLAMLADGSLNMAVSAISFEEIPDGLNRLAAGAVVGRLVADLV